MVALTVSTGGKAGPAAGARAVGTCGCSGSLLTHWHEQQPRLFAKELSEHACARAGAVRYRHPGLFWIPWLPKCHGPVTVRVSRARSPIRVTTEVAAVRDGLPPQFPSHGQRRVMTRTRSPALATVTAVTVAVRVIDARTSLQ